MTSPAISKSLDPKGAFLHLSSELSADLQTFEGYFAGQRVAFEEEMHELVNYCLAHRGKRIRPLLVFLSGGRSGSSQPVDLQLVKAAAVVEMVHLATLIHDDILDEAELRHKTPTVFQKHGAEIAVLLGDAFFAHALHLASDFPTVEVCRSVSLATRRVCAGEIEQNFHKGRQFLEMDRYLRIIELKTAELFKVSCRLGGIVSGLQTSCVDALEEFGRQLGISFQMYDDLLDLFGTEDKSGKTLGTDFASGKWTLPLILYAQKLDANKRGEFVQQWADGKLSLSQVRVALQQKQIPEACRDVVSERLSLARAQLDLLQDAKLRTALMPLTDAMDAQIAKLFGL
jgi:octaprenyl-diphosphate synthase